MTEEVQTEQQWLEGLAEYDSDNRCVFLAFCAAFGVPVSFLDVGCCTGVMVKLARKMDIEAYGIDLMNNGVSHVFNYDLRQPISLHRCFSLVTSIEVVEHIEPEYADVVCDTLARHVTPHGQLILSSALPEQPGYHHVNCQPLEYWRERLEARGLQFSETETRHASRVLSLTWMRLHHLRNNLSVFRRPGDSLPDMGDIALDPLNYKCTRYNDLTTHDEADFLVSYARRVANDGMIVNIGTWTGKSVAALRFGNSFAKIVAIDIDHSRAEIRLPDVEYITSDSAQIALGWDHGAIDLLFVDGSHSYAGIMNDMAFAKHIKPGGWILFHDYGTFSHEVMLAVDDWWADHRKEFKKVDCAGQIMVYQRIA